MGLPSARRVLRRVLERTHRPRFPGSQSYWEQRYATGGHSGAGSYGRLAEYKAQVLNGFVAEHCVQSVVEFGCGDGSQLTLAQYPRYLGLDVSRTSILRCAEHFASDPTKSFILYDPECFYDRAGLLQADLAISLDVIYHLVEDRVFSTYMAHLTQSARRYLIVYSSNKEGGESEPHVRHRQFTSWLGAHAPQWSLVEHLPNPYPFDPKDPEDTSHADFYMFALARGLDEAQQGGVGPCASV